MALQPKAQVKIDDCERVTDEQVHLIDILHLPQRLTDDLGKCLAANGGGTKLPMKGSAPSSKIS